LGTPSLFDRLGGAQFVAWGEAGFTGVRNGNAVRFQISGDEVADYNFIEFLPGTRWLDYSGTATGTVNGDSIVATFNGMVQVVACPGEVMVAQCQAADHRLEFVR
jgi:hypothetical protein